MSINKEMSHLNILCMLVYLYCICENSIFNNVDWLLVVAIVNKGSVQSVQKFRILR